MLEKYRSKRDLARTPGPTSGQPRRGGLTFVVQKHAARRLHYDFRLELDGALKSWAVPRGPSLDTREKRMAVLVEDHPLDYGTFEGVIGHGNYGAGQVIVWDTGVYSPDEEGRLDFDDREAAQERMRLGLEAGKPSFTLRGRKLRGSWTLVRTARSPKDWLLIKYRDVHAGPNRDVLQDDRSVLSGLTIADLDAGRLPDPARAVADRGAGVIQRVQAMGKQAAFPARLKPMLARLVEQPFSHPDWLFEPKLDGFRVMAFLRGGGVTLRSRAGLDLTGGFPLVANELRTQLENKLVLDGELVALNQEGLPDFNALQNSVGMTGYGNVADANVAAIVYYVFDLLHFNGTSLQRVPLVERKSLLQAVLLPGESVRLVDSVEMDGESFYAAAMSLGLEGMVAKRLDGVYEPGARSRSWLKVKGVREQEFVIGGYTRGAGARSATFGALLLGYYDGDDLRYAGKVGSGFDQSGLQSLLDSLSRLHTADRPFAPDPELDKTEALWVRPRLVARVKFNQWTRAGRVRAPVFLGLRSEVAPSGVRRETPEPAIPSERPPRAPIDSIKGESAALLDQLSGDRAAVTVEVAGHRIGLTNLDKPLWPGEEGRRPITKGDMVRYYVRMGPVLLPHLRDRPLTLTRFPNGIHGKSFYQKHWEHTLQEFVETVRLFSSTREGDVEFILVNNLATLVWLAQIANIELHPWLSRTSSNPDAGDRSTNFTGSKEEIEGSVLNYPDFIVFDMDPYIYSGKEKAGEEPELNRRAFAKVAEVARDLKGILDQLSLSSFVKTSDKTGLHVYVPIQRQYDYTVARKTCELISRFLLQDRPQEVSMEWSVARRPGKIFLDHNQNVRGKNMASIYSLRPLPGAPVSTPLSWDELDRVYPTDFTIETVPERVEALGDLWGDVLLAKHDLRRLLQGRSP
jgi:bifunctional non-homologous end joining protein LigD